MAIKQDQEIKKIIKAISEARYLKRIKRAGTELLLGAGENDSVVEHSYFTTLFALVFAYLEPSLDGEKLLTMCLVHDLEEVRTGDLNQINRIYFKENPGVRAFIDMWQGSRMGDQLVKIHQERHRKTSPEAIVSHDCDTLAEILLEKEFLAQGVEEAAEWLEFSFQRLKTPLGKKVGRLLIKTRISDWWEDIKNDIRRSHGVPPLKYPLKKRNRS